MNQLVVFGIEDDRIMPDTGSVFDMYTKVQINLHGASYP
jgi:hypothetical protein